MKHWKTFLFIFAFLACIGIMDYPFLARIYNDRVQGTVAVNYETDSQSLEEKEREELLAQAQKYNVMLAAREPAGLKDAFLDTTEESVEYDSLLDTGENGVMAVLEIPEIDVILPVYHGTSEAVLQAGAGHLEGSSLPVGGTDTHTCISAHRGLPDKKLFTNLDLLKKGDRFYLYVLGKTLAYEIYEIDTVTPDQTQTLDIRPGEDLATLITCTPYGINTHRLYVHAKRIPYTEEVSDREAVKTGENFLKLYWWIPMTIVLLLWMTFILVWRWRNEHAGQ